LVGVRIAARWQQVSLSEPEQIWAQLAPLIRTLGLWFLNQIGNLGLLLLEFLLTMVVAAILYAQGEPLLGA
jgi:hypothetical protein